MKIAFMVGQFPLLSETFILNQITGAIDRGHEVDIYADLPGDITILHGDVTKYKLLDRTTYLPSIPENLLWRCIKGFGLLATRLRQAPLKTLRALNVVRYGKPALSLWLLYSLVPELASSYDIIHCQFGTQSFRGMAFQTVNSPQAKLVTTFRGQDISRFVAQKGPHIYDRLFSRGDYFLANCEFFKQQALELGCPRDRIKVHGSGLECDRFPFRTRRPPAKKPVRIATVGRLVEKKGIEYSIRGVAECMRSYPNLTYTIVGEGELRPELEQLVRSLGLESKIKLVGQKSQEELIDILETCHLFIAPSVTAADGDRDAPVNTLKEAMAMGLPIISTRHGGIPELVDDGVEGFLVPERDASAIARELSELLEHPQRWPIMGRAGRARVEAQYDLSRLNDELATLYRSLLQPDQPPSKTASLLPT
ncbi:glycosyltransferase [Oscillatoriales cyanobacterium LEGE 11467]|uniref:Glycosyltransferase n=1 Tax=Zarconia navalis LEGE 11467 TaxID=1828826 RepID=A0A928VZ17_9CYAN|nr:glycosyltransferase [Zarconia navalis]MBE9041447.1 glycosyltransferase [Zarconia navalis LEGE 11467]